MSRPGFDYSPDFKNADFPRSFSMPPSWAGGRAASPVHRWVAVAQAPYFAWVSTATVLQVSITALNW